MIFKHFLGIIKFKAIGDNPLNFINKIRFIGFSCRHLYCKDDEVFGEIYSINKKKLFSFADNENMQIEVIEKKGIILKILKYKKRYGIISGLIISFLLVFMLSNTALKINIIGCDEKLSEQVLSVLNYNGIKAGKFIPYMDFEQAESTIALKLNDVAWASIRNTGGIVTVAISEATKAPSVVPQRLPCNIIATRDAQIVEMKVYLGQLMVMLGDGVKKGELLVSGFVVDPTTKATYYHSQAVIIAQYEEVVNLTQAFEEDEKIVSDIDKERNYLNFYDVNLPLFIGDNIKGEYNYKEITNKFSLFKYKLPFGITKKIYEPLIIRKKKYSLDEAREKINVQLETYECNFLSDKVIISKEISETITDGALNYSVKYVVEGDIAQTKEILLKS